LSERIRTQLKTMQNFASHGWIGLGLIAMFWPINWLLEGARTHWAFFPLWLGYCLTIDALVLLRRGSSLLTRSWRKYLSLFILSAPVWWLFEVINWRLHNWHYAGKDLFSSLEYGFWATLSFSTVIPAVFGSAEFIGSFKFIQSIKRGPVIRPDKFTSFIFFLCGLIMFTIMIIWPQHFFPFVWISLYFILEPINIWSGNRNLANWTKNGDWRPVIALWLGVLLTAIFWEMWNYFSYPKWVYTVPWGQFMHIFEMPLLGYGGYLPFALELFAVYHFVTGILGIKNSNYVQLIPQQDPKSMLK
jgi:hypothetical protein